MALLGIGHGSATYLDTITLLFITIISIEQWLHMYRRSLVTARRGYFKSILRISSFEMKSSPADLFLYILITTLVENARIDIVR